MNTLTCTEQQRDGAVCLSVSGELDLASVATFVSYLTRASETSSNIIVDLSGLQYMDSSGINALVDGQRRLTGSRRRIVLAAVPPRIGRILQIIALEHVIPMFPTVEAAVESLRTGDGTEQPPVAGL